MRREVEDGMEKLSSLECESLLKAGGVGILALSGVAEPVLRPINFVVHDKAIVIRTGEGQILEAAQGCEPASFVICETNSLEHSGVSVVVTGKLFETSSIGAISELPLRPWARAAKHHFVVLSMDCVSGRRLAEPWERF